MPRIVIDAKYCKGCLLCVTVCPKGAIVMSSGISRRGTNRAEAVEGIACSGCLNCTDICPDAAIEILPDGPGK